MSKAPLTVYSVIPPKHTASFYYRLQVPLETAAVMGLPVRAYIDTDDAKISAEERMRMFCEADVALLYQPVGEGTLNNFRGIQSLVPALRDGDWKWAPTLIVETDDNLFNVSPLNNAFKTLGYRDMEGNEIPVGHHIGIMQDGERRVLWQDGHDGFSLSRNKQTGISYKHILETADCVQCSTPEVESAVLRECSPARTKVFPNLVRFDHYPQVDIMRDRSKVRILWQGGASHYEDWYPLRNSLGKITKKYPEVEWVMWGANYPWITDQIPADRINFIDWCAYPEYKVRLAIAGHDISLAPLTDNVFNRCRSAIKWYEASVLKTPAATLAQNTGAYKAEIEDGKTGLLFNNPDEFEEKLSTLIENEKLRKELGSNAKDWISENRDAFKVVPNIISHWERLREEKRREQPHMTESEWKAFEARELAATEAEMRAQDGPVPAVNEGS